MSKAYSIIFHFHNHDILIKVFTGNYDHAVDYANRFCRNFSRLDPGHNFVENYEIRLGVISI